MGLSKPGFLKGLLKGIYKGGSWDLISKVINKVTLVLTTTYSPNGGACKLTY